MEVPAIPPPNRKPIEPVGIPLENTSDGVHKGAIKGDQVRTSTPSNQSRTDEDSQDDDEEPSVLEALSDDQLARRPSFKRILDDLSSADVTLQKNNSSSDHLNAAAAATLQAQTALQQAASAGGITNPALFSGLFQGIHASSSLAGTSTTTTASNAEGQQQLPQQLSMMLPTQQQLQLQTAILNASSGVVQSLANQTNIPANLLSSALINANMAATLGVSNSSSRQGQASVGSPVQNDTTKKREVRLMKNREAARECRRKKKEYVRCLENRVAVLESQNQALIGELRALKELYLPKSQD